MRREEANRVPIPGSEKAPLTHAQLIGDAPAEDRLDVTVRVRRRQELPSLQAHATQLPQQRRYLSRAEYEAGYAADPADLQKVQAFARQHGLTVDDSSVARRSVRLSGTVAAFTQAFGVELKRYEHANGTYRGRSGAIFVPAELEGIVTGVFGLDDRPFAQPHVRVGGNTTRDNTANRANGIRAFFPTELAQLYHFPTDVTGQGQTIGIIELGGGFRSSELQSYFGQLSIAPPAVSVAAFSGGGENRPGIDPLAPGNPDVEVMLDIQVAGAVAPGAQIVVYFAPDATDQSFLDVMTAAVHDTAHNLSVISISWGGPEGEATRQFQQSFDEVLQSAAHLGITVCAAAGDSASADFPVDDPSRPWDGQAHVDFPASSPFVLACGGTRLSAPNGGTMSEEVWHPGPNEGTGGGVSRFFPLPDYQTAAGVPAARNPAGSVGRGVPDIAADAAQESGYRVLCDGQAFPDPSHNPPLPPIGGTSAVAPLWAGLIALINQSLGTRAGFINPLLYRLSPSTGAFHDITQGDNGDYQAGPGWDPCTGLGTPDGQNLRNALRG